MRTNMLKLVACMAWAGVAISSATPASAIAASGGTGNYAACSADSTPEVHEFCGTFFNYNQTIRFLSVSCNSGGCAQEMGATYTESAYGPGRKVAELLRICEGEFGGSVFSSPTGLNMYGLDTCGC
jgi:hypothetical protein